MMYKAKVAVCSEIHKKHSTQSKHHIEFFILNLVVRRETARLQKVNPLAPEFSFKFQHILCLKCEYYRNQKR